MRGAYIRGAYIQENLYSRGLISSGLISEGAYIRNKNKTLPNAKQLNMLIEKLSFETS